MPTSTPDPPQAGRFPVHNPDDALAVVSGFATSDGSQVLVLLLDAEHTGSTCLAVDDVPNADGVLRIAALFAELARHDLGLDAVVLASVRPGGGAELADVDRWNELAAVLGDAGVTLLEWFVLGEHTAVGIGQLVGAPWRWTTPDPAGVRRPAGR